MRKQTIYEYERESWPAKRYAQDKKKSRNLPRGKIRHCIFFFLLWTVDIKSCWVIQFKICVSHVSIFAKEIPPPPHFFSIFFAAQMLTWRDGELSTNPKSPQAHDRQLLCFLIRPNYNSVHQVIVCLPMTKNMPRVLFSRSNDDESKMREPTRVVEPCHLNDSKIKFIMAY
jgi:hypothetical protein